MYVEQQVFLDGKQITVIDPKNWQNLKLIEQLMYYKNKLEQIKSKVKNDLSNLQNGEFALSQCYLADTYVDFLKTFEQTKKENQDYKYFYQIMMKTHSITERLMI